MLTTVPLIEKYLAEPVFVVLHLALLGWLVFIVVSSLQQGQRLTSLARDLVASRSRVEHRQSGPAVRAHLTVASGHAELDEEEDSDDEATGEFEQVDKEVA